MDAKKLAEEILNQLFPQETLEEAHDEGDEDDNESEDEGDEYEGSDEDNAEDAMKSKQGSSLSGSLQMKPSGASASTPNGSYERVSGVMSANGKSTADQSGKGIQEITPVGDFAAQNAASVQMKPVSFGGVDKAKVQEDVKTLFGAEVSEEFLGQASSLYEAALNTNLQQITEEMSVLFEEKLSEEVVEITNVLQEQVNEYLAYVVEEWVKENQLAIETGLRTEIAENFIEGMKNLFSESYIEVPQDKTNVFDEMTDAIEALESRVNEEIENNLKLRETVGLLEAQAAFGEETKGLKSIDAENIKKIAENVEFSSVQDFRSKVKVLVENYTQTKKTSKTTESKTVVQPQNDAVGRAIDSLMENNEMSGDEPEVLNETIKLYSDALNRTVNG